MLKFWREILLSACLLIVAVPSATAAWDESQSTLSTDYEGRELQPRLAASPEGWIVEEALSDSRIASDPSRGVTMSNANIDGASITIKPLFALGTSTVELVHDTAVRVQNIAPHTDMLLRGTPTGVSRTLRLKSPLAPQSFQWRVESPAPFELKALDDRTIAVIASDPDAAAQALGSVPVLPLSSQMHSLYSALGTASDTSSRLAFEMEMVEIAQLAFPDATILGILTAPTARDAGGTSVPVMLTAVADTILMTITRPVLAADPIEIDEEVTSAAARKCSGLAAIPLGTVPEFGILTLTADTNIVCSYVRYKPDITLKSSIGSSINRRSQSFYFDGPVRCNRTSSSLCEHTTTRTGDLWAMSCDQVWPFNARSYVNGSYVNQKGNSVNVPTDTSPVNDGKVMKHCIIRVDGSLETEYYTVANNTGLPESDR